MKRTNWNVQSDGWASNIAKIVAGLSLIASTAAALVASCCVLPLALSLLGLGGAWLGLLGIFAAEKTYFVATGVTLVVLALLLMSHGSLGRTATGRGTCIGRFGRIVLSLSALLLLIASFAPLWERSATHYLWTAWTDR